MTFNLNRGRRAAAFLLVLALVILCLIPGAQAAYSVKTPLLLEAEDLTCASAILINAETGEALFEKEADSVIYPASATKILTIWLALQYGDMSQTVVVSKEAAKVPAGSSTIPLKAGEEINFRDPLYATMLRSGNEGANAIAEAISSTTEDFVSLMNETALALGCLSTHFANPHGYHDEAHYTTARDMALIARTAMQDETFRDIVKTTRYQLPADNKYKARTVKSINRFLIKSKNNQKTYYADGIGIKTGRTRAAGYCFVGAAERDGVTLISCVFKAKTDNARYTDTIKLMNYGFAALIQAAPANP